MHAIPDRAPARRETVTLRDAFGHPYTVRALSRREVERIVNGVDRAEMDRTAYEASEPGHGSGVVMLDLVTGRIEIHRLAESESLIGGHQICLAAAPERAKDMEYHEPLDGKECEIADADTIRSVPSEAIADQLDEIYGRGDAW